jgi:hypothetical protein
MADDDSQFSRSRTDSDAESLDSSFASLNDLIVSTPLEIMNTVNEIDALIAMGSIAGNWVIIWEKLHREVRLNEDRKERWNLLREHISRWLHIE